VASHQEFFCERNNHPNKVEPRAPQRTGLARSDSEKWFLWKQREFEVLLDEIDRCERLVLLAVSKLL